MNSLLSVIIQCSYPTRGCILKSHPKFVTVVFQTIEFVETIQRGGRAPPQTRGPLPDDGGSKQVKTELVNIIYTNFHLQRDK